MGSWSRQEKRRKTHRAFLSATGVVGDYGVLGVIAEGMVDNEQSRLEMLGGSCRHVGWSKRKVSG